MIYFNISHLLNRIKKNELSLNNTYNIKTILGHKYNLNTPVDSYILTKLSIHLGYNLFELICNELSFKSNNRNLIEDKKKLVMKFKNKINLFKYTNENVLIKINFYYSNTGYQNVRLHMGKTVQFFIFSKEISLIEFSELYNIKKQEILNLINKIDMNIYEIYIWSQRIKINLFHFLSIRFEANYYNKNII